MRSFPAAPPSRQNVFSPFGPFNDNLGVYLHDLIDFVAESRPISGALSIIPWQGTPIMYELLAFDLVLDDVGDDVAGIASFGNDTDLLFPIGSDSWPG